MSFICKNTRKFLTPRHCSLIYPRKHSSIVPFKLADIGEGIAEVELMKWFVKKGDSVKAFDRICEVQSDKATVEITSRYDGIIMSVHHDEGAIVKVGTALVDIEVKVQGTSPTSKLSNKPEEILPRVEKSRASSDSFSRDAAIPSSFDQKVMTTPAVRKLAKENGIDLSSLQGSGPKGRILKEDVLGLAISNSSVGSGTASKQRPPLATSSGSYRPAGNVSTSSTPPQPSSHSTTNTGTPSSSSAVDQRVPIRGIQRLMVKSMNAALQVQHLTYCEEVYFDNMIKLRSELKTMLKRRAKASGGEDLRISYMPIILKATSLALSQFPSLNATVSSDATEMIYHANHNIGVAMDTPKGLLVPVLSQLQNKSVLEIAVELNRLQESAKNGTITEAQLQGGTFTLSNIGSIGGTYAVPVLVVPQVTIGALGRLQTIPRYVDAEGEPASTDDIYSGRATVAPKTTMTVSWSADHRVVDGATIARFSNTWKLFLESPFAMLMDMR